MTRIHSAQGQILVLVLLVVLVGLTVGLSIASRTLTNIKNAGDLDQSNRAYSAAEAGIERALATIKSGGTCTDCGPSISGIDGGKPFVTAVDVGGVENVGLGIQDLAKDDVIQLSLKNTTNGTPYSGETFDLYWGNPDDNNVGMASAVVVSVVYSNAAGTTFGLGKIGYDAFAGSHNNNFNSTNVITGSTMPSGFKLQDGTTPSGYAFKTTVNITSGTATPSRLVPAGNVPVIARVRLLYNGNRPIAFAPAVGHSLPPQGHQITSTASAGGKTRTVKVFKSNATLPAIFDYALFNGSTSALTK